MNTQQRIVIALFIFSILLLAINIAVGKIWKTENIIIQPSPLSADEIDSLFTISLQNFGLTESVIVPAKIPEVKINKEYPVYSVKLPADLPIPVFLSELKILFNHFDVDINAFERSISGKTLIKIYSENELKLAGYIDYSKDLIRKNAYAGFLISINAETDKSVIDDLFNTPEPFAFLFTPSAVMKSFIVSNKKSVREYAVLLGDEIKDLDFKFEAGYSERRLKSSYRNLLGAFPDAAFFVVDDNSSFYKSEIFPYVEQMFLTRKNKIILQSELKILSGNLNQPSDQLDDIISSLSSEEAVLIGCQPDDFNLIIKKIRDLRKVGYKFYLPSQLNLSH